LPGTKAGAPSLSLLGRIAAIGGKCLTGDVGGAVGAEPGDGAGNLVRPADASDWNARREHLPGLRILRDLIEHSRLDRARRNGIHANVLSGVFERDGFGRVTGARRRSRRSGQKRAHEVGTRPSSLPPVCPEHLPARYSSGTTQRTIGTKSGRNYFC